MKTLIIPPEEAWSVENRFHVHISVYEWPRNIKVQESEKGLKVEYTYWGNSAFRGSGEQFIIGKEENMWVCTVDEETGNVMSMWIPGKKLSDTVRVSDIALKWKARRQLIAAINAINRFTKNIV